MDDENDIELGPQAQEAGDARDRVRSAMAAECLSAAEVARQAGVSQSSVLAFLKGREGPASQIGERLSRWADDRARRATLEAAQRRFLGYVGTPTTARIGDVLALAKLGEMVMIAGGSGIGKTTAAKAFARAYPNVWHVQATPATRSHTSILQLVRAAIGAHDYRARGHALFGQICHGIESSDGLIILDEAQHLSDGGIEIIRAVHDRTGVGIAFMGHPDLQTRIGRLPQVIGRMSVMELIHRGCPEDVDAYLSGLGVACPLTRGFLRDKGNGRTGLREILGTYRDALSLAAAEGLSAPAFAQVKLAWATRRRGV